MSSFIDNLKAELHRGVKPSRVKQSVVSVDTYVNQTDIFTAPLREYSIRATYELTGFCKPEELEHVKRMAAKELTVEIYGDYRRSLIALERSLLEEDIDKAMQICMELQDLVRP